MWINLRPDQLAMLKSLLPKVRSRQHKSAIRALLSEISVATAKQENPTLRKYADAAQAEYHEEGELEFDDGAVVSHGEDAGAYVMCWRWVDDETAGVEEEAGCQAVETEG
jgi:hypothetical protein